jgi:hypothetical protein
LFTIILILFPAFGVPGQPPTSQQQMRFPTPQQPLPQQTLSQQTLPQQPVPVPGQSVPGQLYRKRIDIINLPVVVDSKEPAKCFAVVVVDFVHCIPGIHTVVVDWAVVESARIHRTTSTESIDDSTTAQSTTTVWIPGIQWTKSTTTTAKHFAGSLESTTTGRLRLLWGGESHLLL